MVIVIVGADLRVCPFLDEDFFDDDEVPADLSENQDKYLYG